MNSKVFSVTGGILMVLGILAMLYPLIILFDNNPDWGAKIRHFIWEGIVPMIIVFIFTFFPGKIYHNIPKKGESNGFENWSVILALISLVLLAFLLLSTILTGNLEGLVWTMFIIGPFALIPYAIGLLLLLINLFRKKV